MCDGLKTPTMRAYRTDDGVINRRIDALEPGLRERGLPACPTRGETTAAIGFVRGPTGLACWSVPRQICSLWSLILLRWLGRENVLFYDFSSPRHLIQMLKCKLLPERAGLNGAA